MVPSNKKTAQIDLEKIASQLAIVRILPIPSEGRHLLKATVKFTTKTFEAGVYRVSIGVKCAILRLDHPSYEVDRAYQATLPKDTWSESWRSSDRTRMGGAIKGKFGAALAGMFSFKAEAHAAKDKSESAEQKANAPYRIISTTPTGWQIGTELGDPRDPAGTLPSGMEHCLNGEYFSGRGGENGEGAVQKDKSFALCEITTKPGGNDPRIVATLFAASGSLQIAVNFPDGVMTALHLQKEKAEQEQRLRKAFVEICLQRAAAADKDGARTEPMLSGEIYLSHHEVHGPRTPQSDTPTNTRSKSP